MLIEDNFVPSTGDLCYQFFHSLQLVNNGVATEECLTNRVQQ